MSRGGYRPGAGRPRETTRNSSQDDDAKQQLRQLAASRGIQSDAQLADLMPLEYLLSVVRDLNADPARRDRAAIAAAPYFHHRVADERITRKEQAEKAAQRAAEGRFAV